MEHRKDTTPLTIMGGRVTYCYQVVQSLHELKGHNSYLFLNFCFFSVFGKVELPALGKRAKQGIVKALNVYVINDVDEEPK